MKNTIYISAPDIGSRKYKQALSITKQYLEKNGYSAENIRCGDDVYKNIYVKALTCLWIIYSSLKDQVWTLRCVAFYEMLKDCKAVLFCKDWESDKICRMEHEGAKKSGAEIIYVK